MSDQQVKDGKTPQEVWLEGKKDISVEIDGNKIDFEPRIFSSEEVDRAAVMMAALYFRGKIEQIDLTFDRVIDSMKAKERIIGALAQEFKAEFRGAASRALSL